MLVVAMVLDELTQISLAIYYLEVPAQELIWRLSGRRLCGDCGATYQLIAHPPHQALPLVDYYTARGRLRRVDGNRSIEQIRAELVQAILAPAA